MQAAPATAATNAYGIALPIPTRLFKFRAAPVAPASVRTNVQDPLQEYHKIYTQCCNDLPGWTGSIAGDASELSRERPGPGPRPARA